MVGLSIRAVQQDVAESVESVAGKVQEELSVLLAPRWDVQLPAAVATWPSAQARVLLIQSSEQSSEKESLGLRARYPQLQVLRVTAASSIEALAAG